ncbi:MAG TPA: dihydroorotate dehydrogenase (quinone), partial [Alphaproteobacteria bacterium]|nr:dihydroorotate dehydrogenase (quinone) [Alphaproteobacteria bacterium]
INLGKNRDTADAADDYAKGAGALAQYADYIVCNISSPNTPGLRALQGLAALGDLVTRVQLVLVALGLRRQPPLLLKIAPDLTPEQLREISSLALERGVAGLIVSNTTLARPPDLKSPHRNETGGLSGRPLFAASTEALRQVFRSTGGKLTLIGVGGISSGADAYAKVRAGASLVQLYTALVYRGPGLVVEICRDLAARLRGDGFGHISEAIGTDAR